MSRLDETGRDEPIVSLHDRELADVVLGGKLANGRQAGLGAKFAVVDQPPNPAHDLFREGVTVRSIDMNQHENSPWPLHLCSADDHIYQGFKYRTGLIAHRSRGVLRNENFGSCRGRQPRQNRKGRFDTPSARTDIE